MMRQFSKKYLPTIAIFIFAAITIFSVLIMTNAGAKTSYFSITDAVVSEKSDSTEVNLSIIDNNDIKINTIFHNIGDFATYKLTIKNTTKTDYKISSISTSNENTYLTHDVSSD